jgi:hypothetical protein
MGREEGRGEAMTIPTVDLVCELRHREQLIETTFNNVFGRSECWFVSVWGDLW